MTPEKKRRVEFLLACGASAAAALSWGVSLPQPFAWNSVFEDALTLLIPAVLAGVSAWKLRVDYNDAWRARAGWVVVYILVFLPSEIFGRMNWDMALMAALPFGLLLWVALYQRLLTPDISKKFRRGIGVGWIGLMIAGLFLMIACGGLNPLLSNGNGVIGAVYTGAALLITVAIFWVVISGIRNGNLNVIALSFAFVASSGMGMENLEDYKNHKLMYLRWGVRLAAFLLYHAVVIQDDAVFARMWILAPLRPIESRLRRFIESEEIA